MRSALPLDGVILGVNPEGSKAGTEFDASAAAQAKAENLKSLLTNAGIPFVAEGGLHEEPRILPVDKPLMDVEELRALSVKKAAKIEIAPEHWDDVLHKGGIILGKGQSVFNNVLHGFTLRRVVGKDAVFFDGSGPNAEAGDALKNALQQQGIRFETDNDYIRITDPTSLRAVALAGARFNGSMQFIEGHGLA